MSFQRLIFLTLLSLLAFAANSVITRLALEQTAIDEASFIALRIGSGAIFLALFILFTKHKNTAVNLTHQGSWLGALSLFAYAVSFTYGYGLIAAGTGALILFGAVQVTMSVIGYYAGERLNKVQISGFILAIVGLAILMLPGLEAPSLLGASLMCLSGIAWSLYSHQGKGSTTSPSTSPAISTAANFIKAVPMVLLLWLCNYSAITLDTTGVIYALISGVVTSGMGYIVWYSVLPQLKSTQAAIVQLSVPVIVTLAGVFLLNEAITLRIVTATVAILSGTLLVLMFKKAPKQKK
ncbi:DMT family transporter [Colwellia asteriadis]|uniref:DMT family transporter n=1 Tax=Colwellia asteriadis TaxID=517723 RepID=A0ABN1L4F0_9GAMM